MPARLLPRRYQDVYPEPPLVDSASALPGSASSLLTLEYFEAQPSSMPTEVFEQHHVLLNLREGTHRVEQWRDGKHLDFDYREHEVVVTPAGVRSGWRWHATSRCIVVTLEPAALERFARSEVGVLLSAAQLADRPRFVDEDLCRTGTLLLEALDTHGPGREVMFESLARVFLIKLIHACGDTREADATAEGLSGERYRRVLDHVAERYAGSLTVDALAAVAALSPSSFSRRFKASVGVTPMQFVTAYRIERAQEMLDDPERPMSAIASDCGFGDQAHFSRTFKRVVGETPRAWRSRRARR